MLINETLSIMRLSQMEKNLVNETLLLIIMWNNETFSLTRLWNGKPFNEWDFLISETSLVLIDDAIKYKTFSLMSISY